MKSICKMTIMGGMQALAASLLMFFAMQSANGSGCTPDQVEKMIEKGLSKDDIKDLCNNTGPNSSSQRGKPKAPPVTKSEATPQTGNNSQADFEKGKVAHEGKNHSEALKRFQKGANASNADAQWYLGFMYESGQATGQSNYAEAMKWYRKAADQGHSDAMKSISYMYEDGNGVPKDHGESMRWLQKAAAQGDEMAADLIRGKRELEKLKRENSELEKEMNESLKIDGSAGGLEYFQTHH